MIVVCFLSLLAGFAVGFKIHALIVAPVLDDHERLLRREAREFLRTGKSP